MFQAYPNLTIEEAVHANKRSRFWYHENLRDKDTLIVTVGDSWTWGDGLHGIDGSLSSGGPIDHPKRTTSIYGWLLAEKLDADFVNMGYCAGSNRWMIDTLERFLKQLPLTYSKIYIIVTLTENHRELNKTVAHWPKYSTFPYIPTIQGELNLNLFFKEYEANMFLRLKSVIDAFPNITFLVGRNFTYSHEENIPILGSIHLSKTWVDCLVEKQNCIVDYPKNLRVLTLMSYGPLEEHLKDMPVYKDAVEPHMTDSFNAIEWLMNSEFNYKKATKHPTEEGHRIWADYLYEQLVQV